MALGAGALLALAFQIVAPARDSLPPVGIAVRDTTGGWCASIADGSLPAGASITVVYPDPGAPVATRAARVARRRPCPCPSEFPQLSLEDLPAYDLTPVATLGAGEPSVALAVAGAVAWARGAGGRPTADLDGDGVAEEARVCAADEGQHFTLWSLDPAAPARRWHGYYDWGAIVDPTCGPGEDGR